MLWISAAFAVVRWLHECLSRSCILPVVSPLIQYHYWTCAHYKCMYNNNKQLQIQPISHAINMKPHPTFKWCRFQWSWTALSDLAKCLTTRSVMRPPCDSWASCWKRAWTDWRVREKLCVILNTLERVAEAYCGAGRAGKWVKWRDLSSVWLGGATPWLIVLRRHTVIRLAVAANHRLTGCASGYLAASVLVEQGL